MDDLKRNEKGFILSNVDMSKNNGLLEVFISDNRYRSDDFRYIVDSTFKSLPSAIKSQENILTELNKKIQNYVDSRIDENVPIKDSELKSVELSFFNSMQNIRFSDKKSVDKLSTEILRLKDEIKRKNEFLKSKERIDIFNENNINSLAKDIIKKDLELQAKDLVIQNLTEQLNNKLQELENLVNQQLNTTPNGLNDVVSE